MIKTNSVLIPRESIEESPQWNESKIFYIDHGQSVSHKKFRAKLAEGNKVSYKKICKINSKANVVHRVLTIVN